MFPRSVMVWLRPALAALTAALLWSYLGATTPSTNAGTICAASCTGEPRVAPGS